MKRLSAAAMVFAALFLGLSAAAPPAGAATTAVSAGPVDSAAAAKMISAYRASHGLPPVTLDPQLMEIAAVHAQRMAATDTLDHVLPGEGSFNNRLNAGGYDPALAAENIGAGQRTLNDAIVAWEQSPAHNANLLQRDVTEIGIALYSTLAGQYHTYWSLVLARPAPPRTTASASPWGGNVAFAPFGGIFRN